jgi:hypothetical protein
VPAHGRVPARAGARPLHISVFSYRSLLTFKLMKEAPISVAAARPLMQALIPAMTILGIHHPDHPSLSKHVMLRRDPGGARIAWPSRTTRGGGSGAHRDGMSGRCSRCSGRSGAGR